MILGSRNTTDSAQDAAGISRVDAKKVLNKNFLEVVVQRTALASQSLIIPRADISINELEVNLDDDFIAAAISVLKSFMGAESEVYGEC